MSRYLIQKDREFAGRGVLTLYNRATTFVFRAGVFLSIVILAVLAAAMIVTIRKARGFTTYSDAFFPLALLQWSSTAFW